MKNNLIERTLTLIHSQQRDLNALKEFQIEIYHKVKIIPLPEKPNLILGCDLSHKGGIGYAGLIAMNRKKEIVEKVFAHCPVHFPYISGYLTFREFEPFWIAYQKLTVQPDLLIFDGQGLAHPRQCGIATHVGVALDIPSLGCAKSPLFGEWSVPGPEKGDKTPIAVQGKTVGYTVRTREKVKPVFISAGNLITPRECYQIVLEYTENVKLPLPTYYADRFSREYRKKVENEVNRT
jgi:deoxyribonuclease V